MCIYLRNYTQICTYIIIIIIYNQKLAVLEQSCQWLLSYCTQWVFLARFFFLMPLCKMHRTNVDPPNNAVEISVPILLTQAESNDPWSLYWIVFECFLFFLFCWSYGTFPSGLSTGQCRDKYSAETRMVCCSWPQIVTEDTCPGMNSFQEASSTTGK